MRAVVVVLVLALLSQVAVSAPSGIGKSANDGCLCHGDRDQSTTVWIEGLPESYESNAMYNFSITVESETVAVQIQMVRSEGSECWLLGGPSPLMNQPV